MTTLRKAAESMYRRIMVAHEEAISKGDPHQWWHDLEAEWRTLGAALDAAKPEAGAGLDEAWRRVEDAEGWSVVGVNLLPAPGGGWRAYAEGKTGPVVHADDHSPIAAFDALRRRIQE